MDDDSAADHTFDPRVAAPALKQAIADLADRTGKPESDFSGIRLGAAFQLASATYGDELPEFWKVWRSWNDAPDDPAPWGDL